MDEAYNRARASIIGAFEPAFQAGLGHTPLVEILRDLADDLERGDLARDPYGKRDSRLLDAHAVVGQVAAAGAGDLSVHLVAGEAGELDSYETWVHSVHASVAAAQTGVERLNRLAKAVREASASERPAAIGRLLEADPRHAAAGWIAEEPDGLARGLLIEPGTTYSLDSRPLEAGRVINQGAAPAPLSAKADVALGVADVASEANEQFSETLRYLADHPKTFDPSARLAAKQAARDKDDADLAAGRVSAEELKSRNSFATGLDLPNATVRVPNPGAWDEPVTLAEAQRWMSTWINDVLSYAENHKAPDDLIEHAQGVRAALDRWVAQPPSDDGREPFDG